MLKVLEIKADKHSNEIKSFNMIFDDSEEQKFKTGYEIKKDPSGKYHFPAFMKALILNKEELGLELLFGKHLQQDMQITRNRYALSFNDGIDHSTSGYATAGNVYSELSAGFLEIDEEGVYSELPSGYGSQLSVDKELYELISGSTYEVSFSLTPSTMDLNVQPADNKVIVFRNKKGFLIGCHISKRGSYENLELERKDIIYVNGNAVTTIAIGPSYNTQKKKIYVTSYDELIRAFNTYGVSCDSKTIVKYHDNQSWAESARETSGIYLFDYGHKSLVANAIDNEAMNSFSSKYSIAHNNIVDEKLGIFNLNIDGVEFIELFKNSGYGNSIEQGLGGWRNYYPNTSAKGTIQGSLSKPIAPLGRGEFATAVGSPTGNYYDFDYRYDGSKFDMLKSNINQNNRNSKYGSRIIFNNPINNETIFYEAEKSESEVFYYMFMLGGEIESIYHHSIKYLINDNKIGNMIDDDILCADYLGLDLSSQQAKVYNCEGDILTGINYSDLFGALVKYRKSSETGGRVKYQDYYNQHARVITSAISLKYKDFLNTDKDLVIKNTIFSTSTNHTLTLKDSIFNNDAYPFMFSYFGPDKIKSESEVNNIMAKMSDLLINDHGKFSIDILVLRTGLSEAARKAALNHVFSGEKNKLLLVFQETSNNNFNVYSSIVEDSIIKTNDYKYLLEKNVNLLFANSVPFNPGTVIRMVKNYYEQASVYNFITSNEINVFVTDQNDYNTFSSEVEVVSEEGLYIGNVGFLSSEASSITGFTLPLKNSGVFSESASASNTLTHLDSGFNFNDDVVGRLFFKQDQGTIDYIESNKDIKPVYKIDLRKCFSDNTILSPSNLLTGDSTEEEFTFEVLLNGASNNFKVLISNSGPMVSNDSVNKFFNVKHLGTGVFELEYLDNPLENIIVENSFNKVSIVIRKGTFKVYTEEVYFNKIEKDVRINQLKLSLLDTTTSGVDKANDCFSSLLELAVPSDGEPSDIRPTGDLDYCYNLKMIDMNGNAYYLEQDISTSMGVATISKRSFKNDIFKLSTLENTLETKGKESVLFGDWRIVLERKVPGGHKDVGFAVIDKAPAIKESDIEISLFSYSNVNEEEEKNGFGDITELLDGLVVISPKDNFLSFDDLFPYLKSISVTVENQSVMFNQYNDYVKAVYESRVFTNENVNKSLSLRFVANKADLVPGSAYLNFANAGQVRDEVFKVTLEFHGGMKIVKDSIHKVGSLFSLKTPIIDINSVYNKKMRIDKENPNTFVSYDKTVEFEIAETDKMAEYYEVFQLTNEAFTERPLTNKRTFEYSISNENINYSNTENQNTSSVKYTNKIAVIDDSGSAKYKQSDPVEVNYIIRKRPSIPTFESQSVFGNVISVNDECTDILNNGTFKIGFDEKNDQYYRSLIFKLTGTFLDYETTAPIMARRTCKLKDGSTKELDFAASFELSNKDQLEEKIDNSSDIVLDILTASCSLIFDGQGNKINPGDIIDIISEPSNFLTVKEVINEYIVEKKAKIKSRELQIVLKSETYDKTLTDENITFLKDTIGLDDFEIKNIEALATSESSYTFLDVTINNSTGLRYYPSYGLFEHSDLDVARSASIKTFYTYADESGITLVSNNAGKLQYKMPNNTSFIDLPLTEFVDDGITYQRSVIKLATFNADETNVQIRQITQNGSIDDPVLLKVVKIKKSLISPRIAYDFIQDSEVNFMKYSKKEIVFELAQNIDISKYKYRFINSKGSVIQDYKEQESVSELLYITCPIVDENADYILELTAYDISGRLIKLFKYAVLYISNTIVVEDLNCDNAESVETGFSTVNGDKIRITWKNQADENISKYKVKVNNAYEYVVPQQPASKNFFELTHLSGSELAAGTYVFELSPVNILDHESPIKKYLTVKYARAPKFINCQVTTFQQLHSNNINCKVVNYDEANTDSFYYTLAYTNNNGEEKIAEFESSKSELDFYYNGGNIESDILDGTKVALTIYPKNKNGIYSDSVKAEFSFYFKKTPRKVTNDDISFLSLTKDKKPIFLIKKYNDVFKTEARLNNGANMFNEVKNGIYICKESLQDGSYTFDIKYTDIAGNESITSKVVNINTSELDAFKHALSDDEIVDTSGSSFSIKPFFNVNFEEFGHKQLLFYSPLGFEYIIPTDQTEMEIRIPNELDSGIYSYRIYSYDEETQLYDNLIKESLIYFIKEPVNKPRITNAPYSDYENNVAYLNADTINLTFEVNETFKYVDKLICNIKKKEGLEYKLIDTIEIDRTEINKILPVSPQPGVNTLYSIELQNLGSNKQLSDKDIFYFNMLRKKPKPVIFNLNPDINVKYDSKETGSFDFYFEDVNEQVQAIDKIKFNLNETTTTGMKTLSDLYDAETGLYKYSVYDAKAGLYRLLAIAYDKAGNESTQDINEADDLTAALLSGKQFYYFDKIVDVIKPVVLNDNAVNVQYNADGNYNKFNVFFDLPEAELCYLQFRLVANINGEKIVLSQGNTFPYHENIKDIPMESAFEAGIESKYKAEIRNNNGPAINDGFEDIHIHFFDVPTGQHELELNIIDIAGNISDTYIKAIQILDSTQKKPYFLAPVKTFLNMNNIIFEWGVDLDNILEWEYQFINVSKGENFSVIASDWSRTFQPNFRYKVPTSTLYDGQYALKVRGVAKDKSEDGVNIRTDESIKYIVIDRQVPGGIRFLNEVFTQDPTFLKWTWEYLPDQNGSLAAGCYVTFNPNSSIENWEKVSTASYTSEQVRDNGAYTLYLKTFDSAGNLSNETFENTIYIDTEPPRNVELELQNSIVTNEIPTMEWKSNLNILRYFWLIIPSDQFENFKTEYYDLGLTNVKAEYDYIWNKNFDISKIDSLPEKIKNFVSKYNFKKNNSVLTNSVYLNYAEGVKHGIHEDGYYHFVIVGQEESMLYTDEFSYLKITYDSTIPDSTAIKFLKPVFSTTDVKKPEVEISVPKDVEKVELRIKINGSNEDILTATLETFVPRENDRLFKFKPSFNLPYGEYFLEADAYDAAENFFSISRFITIETRDDSMFEDIQSFRIPEINATAKIKKVRYTDSYIIESINISKNSILYYREIKDTFYPEKWNMLKLGETQLELHDKIYEFNVVGYNLEDIK